jgi:hypothetical protein
MAAIITETSELDADAVSIGTSAISPSMSDKK